MGSRALALLTLAGGGAAVLYLLRPGVATEDAYAFLDWGRDLRHGIFPPLLESHTFHPIPVAGAAVLSLFGSAAPTIVVLLSLAGLVLLAAAAWRIVVLLGFGQPAPALAAVLVLSSPLLADLALIAYINLPFATLLLWALVFELEDRRTGAWALLVAAGLVRPEGWAFLVAYGVLTWLRAGRPRAPNRWLAIAALSLGPIALWLALEWSLFGDPFYSFHNTRHPYVYNTGSGTPGGLWSSLRSALALAPIIAGGIGAIVVVRLAPRRAAIVTLGMTGIALLTLVVLASSSFNVPSRHFSVLVPLICVLAAVAAVAPARRLARSGRASPRAIAAVGIAGAALIAGLAAPTTVSLLREQSETVGTLRDTGRTLLSTVAEARQLIDVHGARPHSVAMVGGVDNAALVWSLGVPFDVVSDHVESHTRLIVQPSPATWSQLNQANLTDRSRLAPPPGWHLIAGGEWEIYAPGSSTPVALR